MAKKEHRWPVPIAALTDGSAGTVVWQHQSRVHLTVAVKATFAIPRQGDLQLPVRSAIAPVELPDQPCEVAPMLRRAEVHLFARRDRKLYLAVYRGQDAILNKAGRPASFAHVPVTDPTRAAMGTVKTGGLVRIADAFSWGAMQSAPEDQQLDRLDGTEWVMVGAEGDNEATRVHLPGCEAVMKTYGPALFATEPTLRLDMVRVDLSMMRCSLVWRTTAEVASAAALLNLKGIGVAVQMPGKPFAFPDELPEAKVAKSCPLPDDYQAPVIVAIPAVKVSAKPAAPLGMTMGAAPVATGAALPFGAAPASSDTDDTAEIPPSAPKGAALNMTMGPGAIAAAVEALPFAGGAADATPHVPVGSAGAPWEQPAHAVPTAPVDDDEPSTAVHHFDEVMAAHVQTAEAPPESITQEPETPAAPVVPFQQPAPPPSAPAHVPAPPASAPAMVPTAVVAPPPVVGSAPAAAPSAPSAPGYDQVSIAADFERMEREREEERARVQREFQLEEKKLREQIEAMAADDEAARLAEEKRLQEEERAEKQRKREASERAEAERLRERKSAQDAAKKRADKMRDKLYGFRDS